MLTDAAGAPLALFLFAHQDDEFGVFQQMLEEQQSGRNVVCAYLTDGASPQASAATRNRESLRVLRTLGIEADAVLFAGEELEIGDAQLPHHLERVEAWLDALLGRLARIEAVYVPAWEGGHHDHDALHAVAVTVAARRAMLDRVHQFALYHGYRLPGPFFSVLRPLALNGPSRKIRITPADRLRFLRLCLAYPSQRSSWIGLFPFVALHYLFRGVQEVQAVSLERIGTRPHAGRLYYEKRAFFSWDEMAALLARWARALPPG